MRFSTGLSSIALAAALTAAGSAQAAIQVFDDEASFLAALSNFATDTFDDLPPATSLGDGPLMRMAGSVGYEVAASPDSPILYGAGTPSDPWLSTNIASDFITFSSFSLPVIGIGAYVSGSDLSGLPLAAGITAVRLTTADGIAVEFERNASVDNYWGFVSDSPIVSFEVKTFFRRNSPVWPTVDDLTVSAVPEPGTYAMLLAGLAIVGFVARRRGAGR